MAKNILALASLLLFSGCSAPDFHYKSGIVQSIAGTAVAGIEASSGALFGNESVKISDPTLYITVMSEETRFTLDIRQPSGDNDATIGALLTLLRTGETVSFPTTFGDGSVLCDANNICRIRPSSIHIQ